MTARLMNVDKLVPTFHQAVTVGCLRGLQRLQNSGALPDQTRLLREHCLYGHLRPVRMAALQALAGKLVFLFALDACAQQVVSLPCGADDPAQFMYLLDFIHLEPVPELRLFAVSQIAANIEQRDRAQDAELSGRILNLMQEHRHDNMLRYALLDVLESMNPSKVSRAGGAGVPK